jgi:small ligand-binding sensory domain FIST
VTLMRRFASALSQHPVPAHAVGETAGAVLEQLDGDDPDLVVCFASPHFVGAFDDLTNAMRNLLDPGVLIGTTVVSVIGDGREIEEDSALSLFAACLPEATLTPMALSVADTPDGDAVVGWPELDGSPSALVLLADPFTFPVDGFLRRLNDDRPELTVIGGLASAARGPGGNRLVLDDAVGAEGAVGVFLDGVSIRTVVSQGCRPIGRPFVVTRSERNLVAELAGAPALQRLQEIAADADEEERELLRSGLHLGIVVDEHRVDFGRGDFLVRNVLGADRENGAIAVGERVSVGQTVQFHVRDAAAADDDLRELLAGASAAGALVFTCNGRGRRLFGVPDHDAGIVAELLGPIPAAGAFCAGEIGPIGGHSFLHGFTASVALFD